jgi:acetyl/propionyl-CoA carboxylase alpha subunit
MYQVKSQAVGSQMAQVAEVKSEKDIYLLNDTPIEWDLMQVKEGSFHILYQGQSLNVEVVRTDFETKSFLFEINGKRVEVQLQDKFDILLKKMGMDNTSTQKVSELKAPMPGLIVAVKVSEGQTIPKGETLLILEAMKMENILKAPADVIIKTIKVQKGANVDKNQVLIQFG